jgi:hypothetical protein
MQKGTAVLPKLPNTQVITRADQAINNDQVLEEEMAASESRSGS